MKHALRFVTIALLLAGAAVSADSDLARFTGTWRGEYKGKTFLILELEEDEPLAGTIAAGAISADEQGGITGVQHEPSAARRVSDCEIAGARLRFKTDGDGGAVIYEMSVLADGVAELRVVDAPLKPFRIERPKSTARR